MEPSSITLTRFILYLRSSKPMEPSPITLTRFILYLRSSKPMDRLR
jgi:hypothetical protein